MRKRALYVGGPADMMTEVRETYPTEVYVVGAPDMPHLVEEWTKDNNPMNQSIDYSTHVYRAFGSTEPWSFARDDPTTYIYVHIAKVAR